MTDRIKYPDNKNAKSIFESSIKQMKYTLKLDSSDESAFNIIRNIYECFRMLGDALLVSKGQISEEHVEQIKALEKLNLKLDRPIQLVDNLRRMRHNINYYGFSPKKYDADYAVAFAKSCFNKIAETVGEVIERK